MLPRTADPPGCASPTPGQPTPMLRLALLMAAAATLACQSLPTTAASPTPQARTPLTATAPTVRDTGDWRGVQPLRAEELLARFPGVEVSQTPGGPISVRIRGGSSLLAGEPLYVIDGMAVDPLGPGLLGINPAEIVRIEVLKDAAATALYGMRGANGVVLITTKRARP